MITTIDPAHEQRWSEYVSKHRCDSQSRGSVYDSKAGAHILLHGSSELNLWHALVSFLQANPSKEGSRAECTVAH